MIKDLPLLLQNCTVWGPGLNVYICGKVVLFDMCIEVAGKIEAHHTV